MLWLIQTRRRGDMKVTFPVLEESMYEVLLIFGLHRTHGDAKSSYSIRMGQIVGFFGQLVQPL